MEFNIEKTVSEEALAKDKNNLIISLEEDIRDYLKSRNYGEDVKHYTIKLSCVNPPQGFEHLFKLLPPKYIDLKVSKNVHTGEEQRFEKHFFCSINIIGNLYDDFVNSSDEESKRLLAKEILKSLEYLDKLPKKAKSFDKEKFKLDVEQFFKERELI